MIPKIIHYCWFGGKELPELAEKCLKSWKKYCPDYKIMRWDESNTNLKENAYIQEAYENKKWAFISDYVRLNVLYKYGGVYMDTDVELIKPIDSFLNLEAFSGFENDTQISTGIMASRKEVPFFAELLSYYKDRHFVRNDGSFDTTTNVQTITNIALSHGFIPNNEMQTVCDMTLFPKDYFCPKDYNSGKIKITSNSVCIHHFDGSWHNPFEDYLHKKAMYFCDRYGSEVGLAKYKRWYKANTVFVVINNIRFYGLSATINKVRGKLHL